MKKLFAILLALAMLLSLAACDTGGGSGDSKPTVDGTWKGTIDFAPSMEVSLKAEAAIDDSMPTEIEVPLTIDFICVFSADGTYTVEADEESIDAFFDAMAGVMIDVMYAPRVDLDALLAEEGMTMEEFKEQVREDMESPYAAEAFDIKGFYKYEGGKLYTAEYKADLDAGEYYEISTVTLSSTKLTITDIEQDGVKMSEIVPDMLPIVFTRQK